MHSDNEVVYLALSCCFSASSFLPHIFFWGRGGSDTNRSLANKAWGDEQRWHADGAVMTSDHGRDCGGEGGGGLGKAKTDDLVDLA